MFRSFESWSGEREWTVALPAGEEALVVAAGSSVVAIATNKQVSVPGCVDTVLCPCSDIGRWLVAEHHNQQRGVLGSELPPSWQNTGMQHGNH
jgi:hypothetical protein